MSRTDAAPPTFDPFDSDVELADPPSVIPIDGVFNLRDVGAADDGALRTGLIYRSDGLHHSNPDDRGAVAYLGIQHLIDLRTDHERTSEGIFEHGAIRHHHVPILENIRDLVKDGDIAADDVMRLHYERMLTNHGGAFANALAIVATATTKNEPVVFHCTAGKDRTGILTSLILNGAGVADDKIADDYAVSSSATPHMVRWYQQHSGKTPADKMAEMGLDPLLMRSMMTSEARTMTVVLEDLRSTHGSLENYLDGIGALESVHAIASALRQD